MEVTTVMNPFREKPKPEHAPVSSDVRDVHKAILTIHLNNGLGSKEKIIRGIRQSDTVYANGTIGIRDRHADEVLHTWLRRCYEQKYFDISDHLIVPTSAVDYIEVAWAEHLVGLKESK